MGLADEKRIVLSTNGVAELQIDRVKREYGVEQKRLKLTRHPFDGNQLNSTGERFVCYPPGCTLVSQTQDVSLYVIQQPPTVRSVVWKWYPDEMVASLMRRGCIPKFGLNPQTFIKGTVRRLSFPYVIFVVKTQRGQIMADEVYLYFRTDPIRSWDDDLYLPSVPNFNSADHHICFGTGRNYFRSGDQSLSMQMEQMVEGFWQTPFNDHWFETYSRYAGRVPQLVTPWDWEYHSTHDPLFVLDVPWIPSEKKLKDFLPNQLAPQDEAMMQFQKLVSLGQSAPRYVPGVDDERLIVCPAPAVIFDGVLLVRADVRTATSSRGVFKKGATYTIEHFFEPKKDPHSRMMKLVELSEPVSIKQFFLCTQTKETAQSRFVFEGVEAKIGAYVHFDDSFLETHLRGDFLCVEDMRFDADGDLEVCLSGQWRYATTEKGSKLIEGLHFVELKVTDEGVFNFYGSSIKIGELIRYTPKKNLPRALFDDGYRLPDVSQMKDRFFRVLHIWVSETRQGSIVFMRLSGITQNIVLFHGNNFYVSWDSIPFSCDSHQLLYGQNSLRFDQDQQLLFTGARQQEIGTRLYKPIRLVHTVNLETKEDEIGLEIEFGNALIPVVREGKYVLDPDYEFVDMNLEPLHPGDVLRFTQDVETIKAGAEYHILCFRALSNEIQFSNGLCTQASMDLFSLVSRRTVDGTEETLQMVPAIKKGPVKKKKFTVGERVIYQDAVWRVVSCNSCEEHVQHLVIQNDQKNEIDVMWIQLKHVPIEFHWKWCEETQGRVYRNKRTGKIFQISPRLQKRQAELRNLRQKVGADREGRDLFLGDIICIVKRSFNGNASFDSPNLDTIPMMIIHFAETRNGSRFGYLLTEEPCVHLGHYQYDIYGWNSFQDWGRTLFDERRVGTNLFVDCEKLEPVITEPQEITLPQIPIGSLVQIRSNSKPTFGWGLVKPNEHGVLLEVVKNEVTVRFPSDPEWMGKLVDIERAYQVGDRVRVQNNIQPVYFYGKTDGGLAHGVILEIQDGRVRVEFPEHSSWYGFVEELIQL